MLAQVDFDEIQGQAGLPGLPDTIGDVITKLLPWIFALAGMALLFYLVMGGFTLMLAAGDPKKIENGKHTITNGLIGFAIVFVAFWVVQIIANVLNLQSVLNVF